jgi:mannitol-1-phosphate 5-dehydrogenase
VRVVIVGPGRIGCGYLAPVFRDAGWEIVLAARTEEGAARIRRAGGFDVRITAPAVSKIAVGGVAAVAVGTGEFDEAVAGADLVCTAVGVGNVAALAHPLARALSQRPGSRALDVWVIENGDCARKLAEAVREQARGPLPQVGFAGGVATAVVARGDWRQDRRPVFVGDRPRQLYLDARTLRTSVPLPVGMEATDLYPARLAEKLYAFNAAHAICAYLGWLRHHGTIDQAVADPFLKPMVAGCLLESRRALVQAHPQLDGDLHGPAADAMRRFADPELSDPIPRVAREPLRKLAPGDRLLGAVELIRSVTGRVPSYFSLAVAAALLYRHAHDPQALQLGDRLACEGFRSVLADVCGLLPDDPFASAVEQHYRTFVFTDEETLFPPVYAAAASLQGAG